MTDQTKDRLNHFLNDSLTASKSLVYSGGFQVGFVFVLPIIVLILTK